MAQRLVVERCLQRCSGWRDLNFWKFGEEGLNFDRFPLDKFKPCAGRFETKLEVCHCKESLKTYSKIIKACQNDSFSSWALWEIPKKFWRNCEEIQNISVLDVFSSRLVQQVSWLFDSSYCWPRRLLFRSRCEGLGAAAKAHGSQPGSFWSPGGFQRSDAIAERCCTAIPWKQDAQKRGGIQECSGKAFPNPKKHLQSLAPQMDMLNCKAHGKIVFQRFSCSRKFWWIMVRDILWHPLWNIATCWFLTLWARRWTLDTSDRKYSDFLFSWRSHDHNVNHVFHIVTQ